MVTLLLKNMLIDYQTEQLAKLNKINQTQENSSKFKKMILSLFVKMSLIMV